MGSNYAQIRNNSNHSLPIPGRLQFLWRGRIDPQECPPSPFDAASTFSSKKGLSLLEGIEEIEDFPLACKFISSCTLQLEGPEPQFNIGDSEIEHHKRVYQLVALLLAHRDHFSEVTAVCADIQPATVPPTFKIWYSKNKAILTSDDKRRAEEFKTIVVNNASAPSKQFCAAIFAFMKAHSTPRIQRMCRQFLDIAPKVSDSLVQLIKSNGNLTWQTKTTNNPGDVAISLFAKRSGITPLETHIVDKSLSRHKILRPCAHWRFTCVAPPSFTDSFVISKTVISSRVRSFSSIS